MIWKFKDGNLVTCNEKLKILNENLVELKQLNLTFYELLLTKEYHEALEDAILMGVEEKYFNNNLKLFLTFG